MGNGVTHGAKPGYDHYGLGNSGRPRLHSYRADCRDFGGLQNSGTGDCK